MRAIFTGMSVVVLCAGLTMASDAQDINVPYFAAEGAVIIDADLSDWAGTTWVPLDTTYASGGDVLPPDITSGKYGVRWSDSENMLYLACEVVDTQQHLADDFVAWNGQDDIEIYVDAGDNDVDYTAVHDYAQQIFMGVSNTNAAWCNANIDLVTEFAAADLGDTLLYEIAIVPYSYYTGKGGAAMPQSIVDLGVNVDIGMDLAVGTLMDDGFSMAANNIVPSKFRKSYAMQNWTLVPEPASMSLLALGALALIRRRR